MRPPPCVKDCPKRTATCHANCKAYKDWKKKIEEEKSKIKANEEKDKFAIGVHFNCVYKAMKRNGSYKKKYHSKKG